MMFLSFAFDTTMPAPCKQFVGASVFGQLSVPLSHFHARFNVNLGMLCGDFKGRSSKVARNEDHLRNRIPDSNVYRTRWFAEHQVHWTAIPFGFHQSARHTEPVRRTVQRRQKKTIQAPWRSPDVRQVKLEEILLIRSIEEAKARLRAPGWTGLRSRIVFELVCIAREVAVWIVEDIEKPWIGETTLGVQLVQRRSKRPTSRRELIVSAQSEPNRRRDQDAKSAGRREGKTLLSNPVAGRNGGARTRRRDVREPYVPHQGDDCKGAGTEGHREIPRFVQAPTAPQDTRR